jgi:hypothetical protein
VSIRVGRPRSAWKASSLRYTWRDSPFFVCSSGRAPGRTQDCRSPGLQDLLLTSLDIRSEIVVSDFTRHLSISRHNLFDGFRDANWSFRLTTAGASQRAVRERTRANMQRNVVMRRPLFVAGMIVLLASYAAFASRSFAGDHAQTMNPNTTVQQAVTPPSQPNANGAPPVNNSTTSEVLRPPPTTPPPAPQGNNPDPDGVGQQGSGNQNQP